MVFTKVGNENNTLHVTYYETALEKEGILDLRLTNPGDRSKIHDDDTVDIVGIHDCIPGDQVTVVIHHRDHTIDEVNARCV